MIFDLVKAKVFFPRYAPQVSNWVHKMRGINGRGNPIKFSSQDLMEIDKGLFKMAGDLRTEISKRSLEAAK